MDRLLKKGLTDTFFDVDYVEIWFDSYMDRWVVMANNKEGFDVGSFITPTKYSPYKNEAIELALYHWSVDVLVSNRDATNCKIIERKTNVK